MTPIGRRNGWLAAAVAAGVAALLAFLLLRGRGGASGDSPDPLEEAGRAHFQAGQLVGIEEDDEVGGNGAAAGGFAGRVVAAEDGAPIEGAWVWRVDPDTSLLPDTAAARSGEDGLFRLPDSPEQIAELFLRADGRRPWRGSPAQAQAGEPGGPPVFALAKGAAIRGRVVDEAGRPIAGAEVRAAPEWNRIGWPHDPARTVADPAGGALTTTDAEGRFALPGLDAAVRYEILATAAFHVRPNRELWPFVPGDAEGVELVLPSAGGLELSFETTAGEPIPLAQIWFSGRDSGVHGAGYLGGHPLGPWGFSLVSRPRDEWVHRVWYHVRDSALAAENPVIEVEYDVRGIGWKSSRVRAPIRMGEMTRRTVVMEENPEDPVRPVRFTARLPNGTPVNASFAYWWDRGPGEFFRFFGAQFRDGVAERPVQMGLGVHRLRPDRGGLGSAAWYHPPDRRTFEVDVPPGEGEWSIALTVPADLVEIVVRDPAGRIVPSCRLSVRGSGNQNADARLEPWPEPAILLGSGTFEITATLDGVGGATGVVNCDASGRRLHLELSLDPALAVPYREKAENVIRLMKLQEEQRRTPPNGEER